MGNPILKKKHLHYNDTITNPVCQGYEKGKRGCLLAASLRQRINLLTS